MTKGEARRLFLEYLGERTINGSTKNNADLIGIFEGLLSTAVIEVARARPTRKLFEVTEEDKQGKFFVVDVPTDHAYIMRTEDEYGLPVAYSRTGDKYQFVRPCTVEYARRPVNDWSDGDESGIDVENDYCQLVPLQCAIFAAQSLEEYQYKVPSLQAMYNTMLDALDDTDMPTYRRVY